MNHGFPQAPAGPPNVVSFYCATCGAQLSSQSFEPQEADAISRNAPGVLACAVPEHNVNANLVAMWNVNGVVQRVDYGVFSEPHVEPGPQQVPVLMPVPQAPPPVAVAQAAMGARATPTGAAPPGFRDMPTATAEAHAKAHEAAAAELLASAPPAVKRRRVVDVAPVETEVPAPPQPPNGTASS